MQYFTYVNPNNFFYDCVSCQGPDFASYPECSACQFGYNTNTGGCYPVTCPFGDCADPDVDNSIPEDDRDDAGIIAAIRDVQAQIATGVTINNLDVITDKLDQTTSNIVAKLTSLSTELQKGLGDQTDALIAAIDQVTAAINGQEFPESEEVDLGRTNALLDQIRQLNSDIKCAIGGGNTPPQNDINGNPIPDTGTNCGDTPGDSDQDLVSAVDFVTSVKESEWGGTLTGFSTALSNPSSACSYDFDVTVPYANATLTVGVCQFLEPIAATLRMMFIAFWGLLGIRYIFSA